jgi:membrane protein implicated in regulation of membrane protease activity
MIWASGWIWIIIGLVLAVLELLAPGYVFLGIAIACGLAGLVLLAGVTAPSLPVLLLIVAVLSGVVWLILRRLMGVREGQVRIWDRDINDD